MSWPWTHKEDETVKMVREVGQEVAREVIKRTKNELRGLTEARTLHDAVTRLKHEVEDLTIQRERKEEEFDRREREIEHKLGLHKSQVEHELKVARKEAELKAGQKALQADQKRFEEQMEFHKKALEKQIKSLEGILQQVLTRLPSAEFTADLSGAFGGGEKKDD